MNSLCNIQGKKFKFNKFKFLEIFNNKEGFIEGNANANENDEQMKMLETEFNGKLSQYGEAYEDYIKETLVADVDISTLLGKTAKYNNDDYYISRKGVMRKLQWGYQDHRCPEPTKNITNKQKTKLKVGNPLEKRVEMGINFFEKCTDKHIDSTGKVITDAITNEVAWLDDLGTKRKFIQPHSRDNSCPNGIEYDVDATTWKMIKSGEDLGPTDKCVRQTLTKQGRLNRLNNELIMIASEMKSLINNVQVESSEDDNKITLQAKSLDEIITQLNLDRKKIKILKKEIFSLDGNVRDNKYLVDSSNIQYIGWGVSLITVLVLGLYTMKK
tara:strand:+ start:1408 stop:2391 length:984 start_codon:yes stop_codon:yes gene_type:complete